MDATLTIALAQVKGSEDPRRNLATADHYAQTAAERGARLIIFPEMFMGLPAPHRPPIQYLEDQSIDFLGGLAGVARRYQLAIASGLWERSPDPERAFNTAVVLNPNGELIARYRKIHLFDALSVRESDTMFPGDGLPPVVSIDGLSVGVAICYDLRFPEIFRHLAEGGADLALVLSAWYQGPMKEDHWLTLLRARAIENTFYVAGCNLIGPSFCGRSSVFDPFGTPVASAIETEDCLVATISKGRVHSVREKLPALENRRKDIFGG
ncbi:Predicted amidohydrolase [Desulfacinum infernum DSM 9756]|jgi:predicted amidohydrolase|uniref:Predicted amidohydrolase n=1 Tax=Desulfacinum infernum DSM 9756 TaxID=1121391 RepID=A0A1M4T9Y4_9BACT|nr:carbon-nitrogen hydrolase family protein [Desulfacinum infernum]MBZ4658743.1 carbon-nitrogen hydrolase family protein [Desulfacinum sp.]SHE41164.1 Predicted amidohydrolase [Desulfacinum infernum DSM 9756]